MAILQSLKIGNTSFIDIIYPIGSIYETIDSSFNPNFVFGGTWNRIKGKFLVGVDEDDSSYSSSNVTGGEKTHTLTVTEMPSHRHLLTKPTAVYASQDQTNGTVTAPQVSAAGTGTAGGYYSDRLSNDDFKNVGYTGGRGGVESLIENSFEFKLLRSSYSVTANSGTISGWSIVDSKGSNFIVNSDGTITIGSDIHCIRVWGLVEGTCASGRGWGHLYWTHNGTTNSISGLDYGSYSTVPLYAVFNVSQGDTLWL